MKFFRVVKVDDKGNTLYFKGYTYLGDSFGPKGRIYLAKGHAMSAYRSARDSIKPGERLYIIEYEAQEKEYHYPDGQLMEGLVK